MLPTTLIEFVDVRLVTVFRLVSYDSISFNLYLKFFSLSDPQDTRQFTPEQLLLRIGEISRSKEILFETAYKDLAKRNPIHRRVSTQEVVTLLNEALSQYNLDLNYEFGIFDNDLLTRVQSRLQKGLIKYQLYKQI